MHYEISCIDRDVGRWSFAGATSRQFLNWPLNLAWFIMQERETKTRILESRLRTNVIPEEMDAAAGKLLQASTDFLETYAGYCATLR